MINKVFLDTDVILDFLIDREPFSSHATAIFNLAEENKISLFTSSLCIHNVHYFVRKKLGNKKALEVISELIQMITIQCTCLDHISEAINSGFSDFEDAIQNAVSKENGINLILTRNIKDFKKSNLLIQSPLEFIVAQKQKK
ncbi:PIN domain-containing protein [Ekhidna sp.]|uniref:type II toxin-antitoxin system VapC family toxin n=1 Tax=Ekhidna sp. TaxID=2608089 RepID=UPI0032EE3648